MLESSFLTHKHLSTRLTIRVEQRALHLSNLHYKSPSDRYFDELCFKNEPTAYDESSSTVDVGTGAKRYVGTGAPVSQAQFCINWGGVESHVRATCEGIPHAKVQAEFIDTWAGWPRRHLHFFHGFDVPNEYTNEILIFKVETKFNKTCCN